MILIALIIASLFYALIPAFIVKFLVLLVYDRTVSYTTVLFAMAATYVFASMIMLAGAGNNPDITFEDLPVAWVIGTMVFTFALQVFSLNIVATDERGQSVGFGGWTITLLLQHVVYIALGLLVVFAVAI